jgi:hypothetical protein
MIKQSQQLNYHLIIWQLFRWDYESLISKKQFVKTVPPSPDSYQDRRGESIERSMHFNLSNQ